jgi:hypothetical protein
MWCSAQRRKGNEKVPLRNEGECNLSKGFCLSANNCQRLLKETDSGCTGEAMESAPQSHSRNPLGRGIGLAIRGSTSPHFHFHFRGVCGVCGLTISFHHGSRVAEDVGDNITSTLLQYVNVCILVNCLTWVPYF